MNYREFRPLFLASILVTFFVFQPTLAQYQDAEVVRPPSYTLIEEWQLGGDSDVRFLAPNAIAIDSEDNIYTTEFMGNRVQKFDSDGERVIAWGSEGSENGEFRNPTGIAIDAEGNVYLSVRLNVLGYSEK